MSKIVWTNSPAPSGRYRSFEKWHWPYASLGRHGEVVARLKPVDGCDYEPKIKEEKELIVGIMDRRGDKPKWMRLKKTVKGFTEAKEIVNKFFEANPEWLGVEK